MSKQQGTSKARIKGNEVRVRVSAAGEAQDLRLEAAQKRLRESMGQADTLEAIREIVTNLLGCEEIGLFTVKNRSSALLWSFGIDTEKHATLNSFQEAGLQRVFKGELHVTQVTDEKFVDHPPLRAFIPILRNGRTAAVLVMLKLLPQKIGFDDADINLVNLLSSEAGKALFDGSTSTNA
jgi:hypothetical protein